MNFFYKCKKKVIKTIETIANRQKLIGQDSCVSEHKIMT